MKRRWRWVLAAAVALALVSLASNVTSASQTEGDADTLLAVRSTVSKVVNAGAVWAGLPVLAGWLVRRPLAAVAAGGVAPLLALVVHYGVGQLLGLFDPRVWAENASWFVVAAAVGGPLGLVGATARRADVPGLLARLVVPVGAVVEPFSLGMFTPPAQMPLPGRVSDVVSGTVLLAAGIAACTAVLVRHRVAHHAARRPGGL